MATLQCFLSSLREYFRALWRDILGVFILLKVETKMYLIDKRQLLVHDLFRRLVTVQPDKPCIIFENQLWTYAQMESFSNKIAELFKRKFELKKNDCVAILLDNKPEYVGICLGLSKIGCVSALINTNLKHDQLSHSLSIAKPRILIHGAEFEQNVKEIRVELDSKLVYINEGLELSSLLSENCKGEVVSCDEIVKTTDTLMYIYTSGTTGLPEFYSLFY
jgi:solute carrier family 27 fatty acid transporter 1/4